MSRTSIDDALTEEIARSEATRDTPMPANARGVRPNRARSTVFSVRLNPAEVKRLETIAERRELPPATLARAYIVRGMQVEEHSSVLTPLANHVRIDPKSRPSGLLAAQEEKVSDESVPTVDQVLQFLVAAINQSDASAGIDLTLTVGGTLVTGTLVSVPEWMRRLSATCARSTPESGLDVVFSEIADDAEAARAANPDDLDSVRHIHLADCVHYVGGETRLPTDGRALWRGRLSQVDGWTFGRLGERPLATDPGMPAHA